MQFPTSPYQTWGPVSCILNSNTFLPISRQSRCMMLFLTQSSPLCPCLQWVASQSHHWLNIWCRLKGPVSVDCRSLNIIREIVFSPNSPQIKNMKQPRSERLKGREIKSQKSKSKDTTGRESAPSMTQSINKQVNREAGAIRTLLPFLASPFSLHTL